MHSAVNLSSLSNVSHQRIPRRVDGDLVLFQMGQFYYSAKAFDALEKLDPGSNYWEGKRGACVGVFQLILANKEPKYVFLPSLCSDLDHDFIMLRPLAGVAVRSSEINMTSDAFLI